MGLQRTRRLVWFVPDLLIVSMNWVGFGKICPNARYHSMRAWLLTLAVCGCIDTNSVVCNDGELCPSNTVCTPLPHITNAPNAELCATPDAIAACVGKQDGDLCTSGACHDGVCLPIACGNGYVDPGEACDDHNNASGDGCSADCLSTEVCGNGVRDGIMFEECDDGNLVDGDGCDSRCRAEDPQWKSIAVNQITARKLTAMAYDTAHDQLVMFGGFDATNNVTLSDTWLWSGNSWTRAAPHTVPPARQGHAMVYDAARHVMVMFGGNNGSALHTFSDTWEWDGHDWHVSVTTVVPQRRDGMTMVYDGKRQRVLLFGGHVRTFDNLDYY
jgi:cysteine-rich repeat protein